MATGGAFVVWLMMMGTAPVGMADVPLSSCTCPTCLESTGTGWWHWEQGHCHCHGHSPQLEVASGGVGRTYSHKFCPNLALGIYCHFSFVLSWC